MEGGSIYSCSLVFGVIVVPWRSSILEYYYSAPLRLVPAARSVELDLSLLELEAILWANFPAYFRGQRFRLAFSCRSFGAFPVEVYVSSKTVA